MQLAINSNNVVEVYNLTNTVTGAYVDDANVTVTVRDMQTNEPIGGAVWPVDLPNVGSGRYREVLDSFIELDKNKQYILDITAATVNESTNWQTPVSAVVEV